VQKQIYADEVSMPSSTDDSKENGTPPDAEAKKLKDLAKFAESVVSSQPNVQAAMNAINWLEKKTRASPIEPKKDAEASAEQDTVKPQRTAKYIDEIIANAGTPEKIEKAINDEVKDIIQEHICLSSYSVIFLYDYNQINRLHASSIYQHLSGLKEEKDIFLILKSPGGEVEPAYLISKMCNRFKKSKFIIGIPAEAKSAATLLALGGDELHMGAMSELGPIDPQINDFPALAFSGALEKITKLADQYPGAAKMLAEYLIGSSLDVRALGHYERITESSTQYALRLLKSKATYTEENSVALDKLAEHFTNHYKDHNFVIDIDEAQTLLSTDVVKSETDMYSACNELHKFIETFEKVLALRKINSRIIALGSKVYLDSAYE
jgi:hypothetical protein